MSTENPQGQNPGPPEGQGPQENQPPANSQPQAPQGPPPTGTQPPQSPPPAGTQPPQGPPAAAPQERSTLGLVALIVAVVGFIFACIPGALIVGWILLPIAFILSLVSFFQRGKKKGMGIAALIISIVGTIVGVFVFLGALSSAVDDALSTGDTTASVPADDEGSSDEGSSDEGSSEEETGEDGDLGTRDNPYPLGTEISDDEWSITVNSVNLDATQAVADENEYNDPAPDGKVYILVNVTITYNGTSEEGEMPWSTIEYVTVDGNTMSSTDDDALMVMAPDELDTLTTLYEGASVTGNELLAVPADTASEGVLAVSPSAFGDKVFVAVQ